MKVIKEVMLPAIEFGDLEITACFVQFPTRNESIYMKITNRDKQDTGHALCLETGETIKLSINHKVHPVEACITVRI